MLSLLESHCNNAPEPTHTGSICLKVQKSRRPTHKPVTTPVPYHLCTTTDSTLEWIESLWTLQKHAVFGFLKKDWAHGNRRHIVHSCYRNGCPLNWPINALGHFQPIAVQHARSFCPNSAGPCILTSPHLTSPHPHNQKACSTIDPHSPL
jgi:hypothetical protein